MKRGRLAAIRAHHLTLLAALAVCAALLASALYIHASVRDASELTTRGMAEALSFAAEDALRSAGMHPTREDLEAVLEALREDGLRYVAVVLPSEREVYEAGEPLGQLQRPGLERVGDRARVVRASRAGRRFRLFVPRRLRERTREVRRGRRGALLVLEFEPLAAAALESRSQNLLLVAGATSLGILALAAAFARAQRQREKLEKELERGKRLAALGTMSAVLAHELKNPLASLKGHAQLLAETVEGDEKLSPKAARVVGEAERLQALMEDLLAFVRGGELVRAPTDVEALTREAAGVAGLAGDVVQGPPLPGRFLLDAGRLGQALQNVLRNAHQASPAPGTVGVSVARQGPELVWTVKDGGPGLPPGEEARIFEPFFTTRSRGVGLGLAVTRRIVELHGGRLEAHNREGGGAEVVIRVPAEEA